MIDRLSLVSTPEILKLKDLNIKSETTDLDFKEVFSLKDTKNKVEFIKDFAAFCNSKGGYIIYGVNNNFEWVGLDERSDSEIDEANLSNLIDIYLDGSVDFVTNTVEIDHNYFYVLYIFPTSSNNIVSFKKDGQFNKKEWKGNKQQNITIFRSGDIYCRRGSRSIKADSLFFKQKSVNFGTIENVSVQPIMYNEFIGREDYLIELLNKISNINNRIVQIDGIGGIGKTTFVHYFASRFIISEESRLKFDFVIWTSSKRNKYTPSGIKPLTEFVANYKELIDEIYQFIIQNSLVDEAEFDVLMEVEEIVIDFLAKNRVLLIIDNLETLNDPDLINFLENVPQKLKVIITTRETLGDFFLSRINLHGFEQESEFPRFLNSQFKIFTGRDTPTFGSLYSDHLVDLYRYTKGMPLAGQLISYQLSNGTPINLVMENLKNGKSYEDILSFCFKGSIDKLSETEKTILFIFSLSEKEDYLTLDDLKYISNLSEDEIGLNGIPQLTKISLCFQRQLDSGAIGYGIPFLAKLYSKQYLDISSKEAILSNYERFVEEKNYFDSQELSSAALFYRSKASNHTERVASSDAIRMLALASYDYDLAIKRIDSLIDSNKKFAYLYIIKGKIEENGIYKDSAERAKKNFKIAIDLDESSLEAYIELGYLEYKSRLGNPKDARLNVRNSITFFQKAIEIDPSDPRACLGLAQCYTYQSTKTSFSSAKDRRLELARLANTYYDKAYHKADVLTLSQKHSNAIAAFSQAINYRNNIRDINKAIEICQKGLGFEPENSKLLDLKQQLDDKILSLSYQEQPKEYILQKLGSTDWRIK